MKAGLYATLCLMAFGITAHVHAEGGVPTTPPAVERPELAASRPSVWRLDVPFVAQQKDTCAAAALAMLTAYWGRPVAHDVAARVLLQPELQGILGSRLADFARAHGFEAVAYVGDHEHLRDFISKGRPLIVAWGLSGGRFHDVVVVGFDDPHDIVWVNDPALGSARAVEREEFERRWAAAGHWTLLVLPRVS